MWSVEPEQIWKKPRVDGISGFMRLKNEAEFVDRAIASHIGGLDELIIVHNDCSDETPAICHHWQRLYPEKIKVYEYEPKVVPICTPESLKIDPRSPHCIANYYNYALSLTNRKIVIKVDGDHHAISSRFRHICDRVRRVLPRKSRYPIYGLNLTFFEDEIAIYNYYNFKAHFSGDRAHKKGPPPFTAGDHCFYYIDETCWHTVDPVEGYEALGHRARPRYRDAPFTYAFFHLKGMKADRGVGNWVAADTRDSLRSDWMRNVKAVAAADIATIEEMRRHNPVYFRGANVYEELRAAFPDKTVRQPAGPPLPRLSVREHLADMWYRVAYP